MGFVGLVFVRCRIFGFYERKLSRKFEKDPRWLKKKLDHKLVDLLVVVDKIC